VRIKAEAQEASKQKFRIEHPDKKKRAKIARDDKRSSALETVVPIVEARIRGGFDLNILAKRFLGPVRRHFLRRELRTREFSVLGPS
jgi:hypothetical protein